ncbi:hypothetical protein HGA92_02450 [Candidatus Gracilibacteria bacterium]|nr:hypothetical protein [Candidatus Gracilibacteria bacterium]NUJ99365.1 hypothetical protein [Candidatus Gracilibacteria bacterium]
MALEISNSGLSNVPSIDNFTKLPEQIEEVQEKINIIINNSSHFSHFYDTEASGLESYKNTINLLKEKYKNERELLNLLISIEEKFDNILKAICFNNLEVKITHMQDSDKLKILLKQLKEQRELENIGEEQDSQKRFKTRSAIRDFIILIEKYKDFFPEDEEYQTKIENLKKQFKENYKKLLEEIQGKTKNYYQIKLEQLELFETNE